MCKHKYVQNTVDFLSGLLCGWTVVKTYSDNVQHDNMEFRAKMDLGFDCYFSKHFQVEARVSGPPPSYAPALSGLSIHTNTIDTGTHTTPPSETRPPNIDNSFRKQYLLYDTLPLATPQTCPRSQVFVRRPDAVDTAAYSHSGSLCRKIQYADHHTPVIRSTTHLNYGYWINEW